MQVEKNVGIWGFLTLNIAVLIAFYNNSTEYNNKYKQQMHCEFYITKIVVITLWWLLLNGINFNLLAKSVFLGIGNMLFLESKHF